MARILIVDDEASIRLVLRSVLRANGYETTEAGGGDEALARIKSEAIDLMLCDIRMAPMNGVEVLQKALPLSPSLPVIMLTAYGSVDTAEEAMKLGAFNYLTKPWRLPELLVNIRRALSREARAVPETAQGAAAAAADWQGAPWQSDAERIAACGEPALIVFKGADPLPIARSIHAKGSRSKWPFAVLSCATMPEPIMEIEMYGCARGAVSALPDQKAGVLEFASTGTLVLDEVVWMPHKLQEKLVNILREGAVRRIGGFEDIPVDVRVLATTNMDPDAILAEKSLIRELHAYLTRNVLRVAG
ncbi:MAG: sigma-54-dependent Fis family transcriptional regulator [Lentisphaerae bacterium]|nr:sigma-54-dependent Fis family transcriptional regulator [Lentisphaerota bacterium]